MYYGTCVKVRGQQSSISLETACFLTCYAVLQLTYKLPHLLSLPLADVQYHVWLFVGSGELNLGPHACDASPFSMEPPQSHLCVL